MAAKPAFDNVLFVLDCSASMEKIVDRNRTRMMLSKDTIKQIVESLPPTTQCGLRVFGERAPEHMNEQDRNSTELVTPFNTNHELLFLKLKKMEPSGLSNSTQALFKALSEDLPDQADTTSAVVLFMGGPDINQGSVGQVTKRFLRPGVTLFFVCLLKSPASATLRELTAVVKDIPETRLYNLNSVKSFPADFKTWETHRHNEGGPAFN
ncbi:MAG: VWA domain-containing protein [Candidatus Obscuribacterales bacterium]|nr:VWA domain-containing protein [Candidatus Obscuribacterales bacterium]